MEFDTDYAIRDFLDNLPVGQVFTDYMNARYEVIEPGVFVFVGQPVRFTSHAFDASDTIELEVSAE